MRSCRRCFDRSGISDRRSARSSVARSEGLTIRQLRPFGNIRKERNTHSQKIQNIQNLLDEAEKSEKHIQKYQKINWPPAAQPPSSFRSRGSVRQHIVRQLAFPSALCRRRSHCPPSIRRRWFVSASCALVALGSSSQSLASFRQEEIFRRNHCVSSFHQEDVARQCILRLPSTRKLLATIVLLPLGGAPTPPQHV